MQELSMNILDIAQNSVRAEASRIDITLEKDTAKDLLTLTVADDGCGMDAEMVKSVTDPFVTTRTTRKIGLGLPFLKMAAEMTGGQLRISSTPGKGTTVSATFGLTHIDLAPIGDMGGTLSALCSGNPDTRVVYTYRVNGAAFTFDTEEAKAILGDVPLSEPSVALFIRDYVSEGMAELDG